jgi:transcriptional regulator with XRE-family HTH domain
MILNDFAIRVRKLRQQSGISQEKFALKIGMDRTYYASVESGRRNISLVNIDKIAKGFELTLSELFQFGSEENDD